MIYTLILLFIIGYGLIIFEHNLNLNKTATALITGALLWATYAMLGPGAEIVKGSLQHILAETAEILFFLLGAMTIVELIDANNGFRIITNQITTTNPTKLLWVLCFIGFFLAAIIDNLAAAIVMVTVLRKLIKDTELRKLFVGMIVIAVNAGGLWSPIGSITTTMLWIAGRISPANTVLELFLPAVVNTALPLLLFGVFYKKKLSSPLTNMPTGQEVYDRTTALTMLAVGFGSLLSVPIFKTLTHLPPYLGMMLALGLVWIVGEFLHNRKDEERRSRLSAAYALSKIDTSSILFFLGILLAVGALDATGILKQTATWLDTSVGNKDLVSIVIGLASAVVDNVPLVAATIGMYPLEQYPMDHKMWEFIAYCAGTGGSILIIGSAAGVAVMGMEKIDFVWFFKKISLLALIGYFAGAATYLVVYSLMGH